MSLWSYAVGEYGYTVTVEERRKGGNLYIRYTGMDGKTKRESLGHKDRDRATEQARERASVLLRAEEPKKGGPATLDFVLAGYIEEHTSQYPEGHYQIARDKLRAETWMTFLSPAFRVEDLDSNTIRAFERARMRGEIQPPGRNLGDSVKASVAGADVKWLSTVLNWATRTKYRRGPMRGKPIIQHNPIRGYTAARTKSPDRPVATWDRYRAVREHGAAVNWRFPFYMDILVAQGWRATAVRRLEVRHVKLARTDDAPYGRIYRPPLKQETGAWVPMKSMTREAVDALLARSEGIGSWPLFPSPRNKRPDGTPKAWSRSGVYLMYKTAERAAVEAGDVDGEKPRGALHMYRRMWATTHKHLPRKDVMSYAGWKSEEVFRQSYEHVDSETTLEVVENERKLREGEV